MTWKPPTTEVFLDITTTWYGYKVVITDNGIAHTRPVTRRAFTWSGMLKKAKPEIERRSGLTGLSD